MEPPKTNMGTIRALNFAHENRKTVVQATKAVALVPISYFGARRPN
jgi:hypothetical protein